jgi:hypothetical protein
MPVRDGDDTEVVEGRRFSDVAARVHPASLDRQWLVRALLVLQAPRAVFAALRDDSDEAANARQEPILALMWLAGIAGVLTTSVARTLLDDRTRDSLVVAVWAFLGGGFYGALAFWLGGALLHGASHALGGQGSYRRARHVVAFASAPVALSLLLMWPVGLAAFGSDLFRSGGSDAATGGAFFFWVAVGFGVWAVALLAIGIRAVHGWTWLRSLVTLGVAAAPVVLVALLNELV